MVHGPDHSDQIRASAAKCCKGVAGHGSGIPMSGMRCDHCDDLPLQIGYPGLIQVVIDQALQLVIREQFGATVPLFTPARGNGGASQP